MLALGGSAPGQVRPCSCRKRAGTLSLCARLCTRQHSQKAGPFSVARLRVGLPFHNQLAYDRVHRRSASPLGPPTLEPEPRHAPQRVQKILPTLWISGCTDMMAVELALSLVGRLMQNGGRLVAPGLTGCDGGPGTSQRDECGVCGGDGWSCRCWRENSDGFMFVHLDRDPSAVIHPLLDDDEAEVDLPFPFDLFGTTVTTIHISSNGYISIGGAAGGQSITGHTFPIPAEQAPDGLIAVTTKEIIAATRSASLARVLLETVATSSHVIVSGCTQVFWSDLDPGTGGSVFSKSAADQFVVQVSNAAADGSFGFPLGVPSVLPSVSNRCPVSDRLTDHNSVRCSGTLFQHGATGAVPPSKAARSRAAR